MSITKFSANQATQSRSLSEKLCIGTVQFGFNYGISNTAGRPTEQEVAAILDHASKSKVGYLDTAVSYGDAETLIGRHLPRNHALKIITKLPPIHSANVSSRDAAQLIDTVKGALDRLKVDKVYGLLFHRVGDLAKPGGRALAEAMLQFQSSGLTEKIGISAYDASEIRVARDFMPINLVQVPFNVLDRRLDEQGILAELKDAGVEVHVRSVFLQGLLLMHPNDLPAHLAPVRPALIQLREHWAIRGLTPLAACLGFVLQHPSIDVAVLGVNSLAELREIEAAATLGIASSEHAAVAVPSQYLNPALWQTLAR